MIARRRSRSSLSWSLSALMFLFSSLSAETRCQLILTKLVSKGEFLVNYTDDLQACLRPPRSSITKIHWMYNELTLAFDL